MFDYLIKRKIAKLQKVFPLSNIYYARGNYAIVNIHKGLKQNEIRKIEQLGLKIVEITVVKEDHLHVALEKKFKTIDFLINYIFIGVAWFTFLWLFL